MLKKIGYLNALFMIKLLVPVAMSAIFARLLDTSIWGAFIIAQSIALWISMTIEFGFGYSSSGKIAELNKNGRAINIIYTQTESAKIVISFCIIAVFTPILFLFYDSSATSLLIIVLGVINGFYPMYFYTGVDIQFRPIIYDIASQTSFLISVIILSLYNESVTIQMILISNIIWQLVSVVLLHLHARSIMNFRKINFSNPLSIIKQNASLFIYRFSVNIYHTSNMFIINKFLGPGSVAIYGSAEKIYRPMGFFMTPVYSMFFPKIVAMYSDDKKNADRLVIKLLVSVICLSLLQSVFVYFNSELIIGIIFGDKFLAAAEILKLLAVVFPIGVFNNVLANIYLTAIGEGAFLARITSGTAVVSIAAAIYITKYNNLSFYAYSVMAGEIFILVSCIIRVYKIRSAGNA